jgi:GGDEF domain-containing protein
MKLPNLRNAQGLVLASVLLALGILAFEAVRTLRHEYRSEVAEILSSSDRTAQKLAARTAEVFDRVNQTTLLVKYLNDKGALPPLSSLREAGVISDDLVQFVYVADRRGFIVDTTAGHAAANVADEDFFKRHRREADLDVSIAPVWTNPLTGVQGIPVTRRLDIGAAFDGLITATVNPTALSVDYARTEARGTAVGVLGADGIFRSRTVDGKHSFGDRADPARLVERAADVRTTGLPLKSPIDGRSRFLSAVKVDKYPLYAVVAVDAENALSIYRHTREKVVTWAAVVALGVLLVGWVVWVQIRRLDASGRRTRKAEAAFRATLEGSLDAVAILRAERDADGVLQDLTVTDCNTLAASLVGLERQQLLGRRLCEVTPTMSPFLKYFDRVILDQQASQAQVRATEPHVLGRWLHYQLVPLEDGVALITRDVTEKKSAQEALAALARCDGLTKLSNRRHFEEVLDAARARAIRGGETMALMYIDLDGFKAINDTLGHAAGDAVLVEVARRLKAAVRETDTVARLGGDEFVVLTERAGSVQDVLDLCARIVGALR